MFAIFVPKFPDASFMLFPIVPPQTLTLLAYISAHHLSNSPPHFPLLFSLTSANGGFSKPLLNIHNLFFNACFLMG